MLAVPARTAYVASTLAHGYPVAGVTSADRCAVGSGVGTYIVSVGLRASAARLLVSGLAAPHRDSAATLFAVLRLGVASAAPTSAKGQHVSIAPFRNSRGTIAVGVGGVATSCRRVVLTPQALALACGVVDARESRRLVGRRGFGHGLF